MARTLAPAPLAALVEGALGATGAAVLLAPVPAAFLLNGHELMSPDLGVWAAPVALLLGLAALVALRTSAQRDGRHRTG
jgi:hypothetical protein